MTINVCSLYTQSYICFIWLATKPNTKDKHNNILNGKNIQKPLTFRTFTTVIDICLPITVITNVMLFTVIFRTLMHYFKNACRKIYKHINKNTLDFFILFLFRQTFRATSNLSTPKVQLSLCARSFLADLIFVSSNINIFVTWLCLTFIPPFPPLPSLHYPDICLCRNTLCVITCIFFTIIFRSQSYLSFK